MKEGPRLRQPLLFALPVDVLRKYQLSFAHHVDEQLFVSHSGDTRNAHEGNKSDPSISVWSGAETAGPPTEVYRVGTPGN
jgi:hypothetical protein